MIIGIDGNEANIEKRVGVNTYTYEILWGLYNIDHDRNNYIIYLKSTPREDLPRQRENWKYKILPGGSVWIISRLVPHLLFTNRRPDVFFTPSHYVPPLTLMPRVCSIMDMGYLKFSTHLKKYDYWQLSLWSAYSMLVAKYIFAISTSTKEEIVNHYPFAKNKVVVTPLSYDTKKFNSGIPQSGVDDVKKKYNIDGEYVLFLSTLKPSKNLVGLIDAFIAVNRAFPQYKLVVAGKKGWMYDQIFRKVRDNHLEKHIIFTDFVAEADKPFLIKGAKLFALPSYWEGFGLDALNAMAAGVPVVVSNKGSLPEVVGDAGIIVDPHNIDDIAQGIKKVLSMDKKDYTSLVAKGLEQAKKFSWKKTAAKTLEVLELAKKK
ncbi:MAG: glycosyltransferase family 1 protein [Patescibacteria group bacterium]